MDGKPGKNYWQNTANYNITLTVLPPIAPSGEQKRSHISTTAPTR